MSSFSRLLRLSANLALWSVPTVCLAQSHQQFAQPTVQPTGGRVTQIVAGTFQQTILQQSGLPDLLYLNAPTVVVGVSQVVAGELLNGQGYTNLGQNQITFTNVTNVAAAVADLDGDQYTDFAFALSPAVAGGNDLCVYYGTGLGIGSSSYSGGSGYPATGSGKSGCMSFPVQGSALPMFRYIAAAPFRTSQLTQLFLEDTANGYLYALANTGAGGSGGALTGFSVKSAIQLAAGDGAGPIFTADLNGDGTTDLVVNGQTGNVATVYLGRGDGTYQAPVRYAFDKHVHSLLLHDMDGDHVLDMVVEGDRGAIEIFRGIGDGSFATPSVGGTAAGLDGFSGNGGQLVAAIDSKGSLPAELLTATPAGISVLQATAGQTYTLKGIYNAGPGRSSYAVADFNGDQALDLAVDSAEGVAFVNGDGLGGFTTSTALAAGAPVLGTAVGVFRDAQHNPARNVDVLAATTLDQGQLLLGDGAGGFAAASGVANPSATAAAGYWSFPVAGDFDGDQNLDVVYAAVGAPSTIGQKGLTITYGNGDGTFNGQSNYSLDEMGLALDDTLYGAYAVGDLNGDSKADLAVVDLKYFDTLLGSGTRTLNFGLGMNTVASAGSTNAYAQVAAGFFASGRTTKQDLVFQNGGDILPYSHLAGDGRNFAAMPKLAGTPDPAVLFPAAILLADMDGDGKGDIVVPYFRVAGGAGQLYIWYGNGDGSFVAPQIVALGRNDTLAAVVDMNSDGLADVVLADGTLLSILYNQGGRGAFSAEQHFLAGQGINSLSVADVNRDGYPDLIVGNGGATLSNPLALGAKSPGVNSLTLAVNPDVNTGGVTVLLNKVNTRAVTGQVKASVEPSRIGQPFTLTATLTPSVGVALPTGSVQFAIDGVTVGSPAMVTAGTTTSTASYTVPAGNSYAVTTPTTLHTISAYYSGDQVNSGKAIAGTHAVQPLIPTTTTLALCIGPSASCPSSGLIQPPFMASLQMYYGQTFNGTAQATASDGSALDRNSTIAFNDSYNGVPTTLCQLGAVAGSSCPPQVGVSIGTSVGTNVFTAVYSGDATHAGSTSPSVTIQVSPDTTQANLSGTPNSSPVGSPVAFTATLIGNYAAPTGTVTLSYNGNPVGTGTLVAPSTGTTSTATIPVSTLPVGNDTVTLTYAATQNFQGQTATFVETITPLLVATTTTLNSNLNPSTFGQSIMFNATVSSSASATGLVTFLDGTTVLGTGTLNGAGVATFSTSGLAVGSHSITASYGGSSTAAASVSAAVLQQVNPVPGSGSFTVTVTPTPVTIGVGLSASLQVTVTALNGFAQAVNLSCANLPSESTCTFVKPTIPVGGGTTSLVISTMAPHTCGTTQPYFTGRNGSPLPFGLPALAGLAMLFIPGRRRWLHVVIVLVAVAGAMQMTGCSTCTDLGTRPNTYTIQVSGAAAAGTAEVETQVVTMKVTI